ncbi:MAG: hypothetical protein QOH91_1022 [Mycobacterium sp.]|nr:hypothetical protein [Mycobacterium sp.]
MALAYLLGGFSDFHRLGAFNRLHLACLIFGEPAVDESLRRATERLDRWGYRDSTSAKHRLWGVFSQALLLNRSPQLDDLDTAAFAALRAHPATDGHQGSMLYAQQRVVAALGYCDPPVRTGYLQPAGIEGANPVWAAWIQRWHATSTLTPRVRATIRTIMAKAGRWLAVEHPEITEPGVEQSDLCGLGRRGRPDDRRRLDSASLHLQLFRAMPAPNGLCPLRFLHTKRTDESSAARGQGQPAAHARHHPAHRRRTRSRRRRTHCSHQTARPARRRTHSCWTDPA